MSTKFRMRTGVAALAAAAALLGSVAMTGSVNAAAGDPPFPGVTIRMNPANGSSGTVFGMDFTSTATGLPVSAVCPGDNPAGWFWTAFIVPAGTDIGALTFGATGSPVPPAVLPSGQTASQFRPLATPTGTFLRSEFPGLGDGSIAPPAGLWLGNVPLPAGGYRVGVACYDSNNATVNLTGRYFSTPITVTSNAVVPVTNPQGYTYAFGAVPAAPAITTAPVTVTGATVNFTHAASTPATTGYTATVTPTSPAGTPLAPIAVAAGATSFTVPGLTTGTTYSVSLTATNTTGASPASNTLSFTPSASAQPAIVPTLTPGVGQVTVNIPAVTIGGARTALPMSYTLAVSPAPAAPGLASYTIPFAVGPLTQMVPGITAGTPYTFTLTVSYTAPDSGPGGMVAGTSNSAQIIQQRITVTRPLGQLILTQRCGVNGGIPNFTGTAAVPGFPTDLPAIVASPSQIGTTPDITPAAPGLPANTVDPDSEFGVYPFPLTPLYPTECGISLGTSTIVTSGAGAGLYFQADGRINEVTVSDTRDTNRGWTLNGRMNDFIGLNTPTNTFDGDWMGWVPQLQNSTANQIITTGGTVLPGTGVAVGSAGPGLGSGRLLGSAAVGAGLGVTQFDARLLLLIPTNTPTDDYVGLLDFTVA